MTAVASLAVLVAALAIVVVPGGSVLLALRPGAGVVSALALAPATSLGLVWTWATVLHVVGAPVTSWTVLPWLGAVVAVALVGVRRRGADVLRSGPLLDRWEVLGLGTAVMLGLVLLWWGTSGLQAVPPNDDGAHHGLFVARILATGQIDLGHVMTADVLGPSTVDGFYPLALHVVAAVLAGLGSSVGVALNVTWIAVTVVSLPLGMAALARRTFPFARRAAVAVAVVSVLAAQLPVRPTYAGLLPLVAGMAMVPGVVDGVVGLVADRLPGTRAAVLSGAGLGIAGVGVAFAHSSEVVTVAVMVACLGIAGVLERTFVPRWRQALVGGASLVVVVLVVSTPWLPVVRSRATQSLSPADPASTTPNMRTAAGVLTHLLGDVLGSSALSVIAAAAAVVGVVVAVRRRSGWGWFMLVATVVLLDLARGLGWPGGAALTAAWYSQFYRVASLLVYPWVALVGLGTWWLARALRRVLSPAPVRSPRWAAAIPVCLALLLVAVPVTGALLPSAASVRDNFAGDPAAAVGGSLATADARASWQWLAAHTAPGDRVLNQFADGSAWMYADAGLAPLFPMKVVRPLTGDAGYLFDHAADLAHDADARRIATHLRVHYAYLGTRLFPDHSEPTTPLLSAGRLIDGGWRVVFRTPSTVVLEAPAVG